MAKTKRECPALGHSISSARCGEERGVVIPCPPDCAYNPFAPVNYEDLPDIESRLFKKTLQRFDETFGERAASSFQDDVRRTMDYPLVQHGFIQRRFYHDRDSTGQTLAERWAQDRWVRLIKGHVRSLDREALRRGTIQDINWLIRDLALNEIELPPPPLRTPPDNEWDPEDEEGDGYGDDGEEVGPRFTFTPSDQDWQSHAPPFDPPPPSRILDELDLANRLEALQTSVSTVNITSRMDETSRAWPGLKEIMHYSHHHFNQTESVLLALNVWQLINVLHPTPPPGAFINLDRWRHYFEQESQHITTAATQDLDHPDFGSLTLNMPQPSVASWLAFTFIDHLDLNSRRPRSRRMASPSFRPHEGIMALCLLRALLRELCHWPIK
ncbi:MAG: hypothetical protein ACKV19_22780 [Verrucomicrobiales bacterium]